MTKIALITLASLFTLAAQAAPAALSENSHFLCRRVVNYEEGHKKKKIVQLDDRANFEWRYGNATYTLANFFLKGSELNLQPVVQQIKRVNFESAYNSYANAYSVDLAGRVLPYQKSSRFLVEQNGKERKLWNVLEDGAKGLLESTITELNPTTGATATYEEDRNMAALDPVPGITPISSVTTCDIYPVPEASETEGKSLLVGWTNKFDQAITKARLADTNLESCLAESRSCDTEKLLQADAAANVETTWNSLIVKKDLYSIGLIGKRIAKRKAAERAAMRSSGAMESNTARRIHCFILELIGNSTHTDLGRLVGEACRRGMF